MTAWDSTVGHITSGHVAEFLGRKKEALVFRYMKQCLASVAPGLRIELEVPHKTWEIDLVARSETERVAVEGKFKLQSDGAVPDNRKAAFCDLYKLEEYVDDGGYSNALFLWLTNKREYTMVATGDSREFSTHDGRIYMPGIHLHAKRCRDKMPLPLVLTRRYDFAWKKIGNSGWLSLALVVEPGGIKSA